MAEVITSTANAKVKHLVALSEKSSLRKSEGVFVLEGAREVERAIAAGYQPRAIYVCPDIFNNESKSSPNVPAVPVFEVSKPVYEKIAYRGSTEGVVAEMYIKDRALDELQLGPNPLVVVLEGVEKPGNLGAVLRSADAVGIDALILADSRVDLYNPNVLRASTGAVFSVPTIACTSAQAIDFLKDKGINIYTAQLQDSELYYDTDFRGPSAIVFGTEATGLTNQWRLAATSHIRIPMNGISDSLNVSVSAAVLMYEALRQRCI